MGSPRLSSCCSGRFGSGWLCWSSSLDIILYSVGGVIGTMHHLHFSGAPAENMSLGAVFSALEVIPLTFLTVEAWSFLQLGARQETKSPTPFPRRWAVIFLVAAWANSRSSGSAALGARR